MPANIHLLQTDIGKINGKDILAGDVTLSKDDIGLDKVNNTPDAEKVVASAGKLTTPVLINGVAFDGSANITVTAGDANAYKKGEDVEIASNKNLILTSPDGTKFSLSVNDTANLVTTEIVVAP